MEIFKEGCFWNDSALDAVEHCQQQLAPLLDKLLEDGWTMDQASFLITDGFYTVRLRKTIEVQGLAYQGPQQKAH